MRPRGWERPPGARRTGRPASRSPCSRCCGRPAPPAARPARRCRGRSARTGVRSAGCARTPPPRPAPCRRSPPDSAGSGRRCAGGARGRAGRRSRAGSRRSSWPRRPCRSSNSARLSGLSASSAGSTMTSASSRSPSSRSSLAVNFACAGPRRPTTWISPHPARRQGVQRVLGDVGMPELVDRLGQDPAHVGRHVALAHDDRDLLAQVERPIAIVGVTVVPADEFRGRVAPGQFLARHAQPAIALGAAGEDHRVVRLASASTVTSRPRSRCRRIGTPGERAIRS